MNILLLGSGGRECALAYKIAQSTLTEKLYIAPGNAGTAEYGTNVIGLDIEDGACVSAWALDHGIDLIVVGPEAPLVTGVADVCRQAGIAVFGPDAQGALLEGSKRYSKEFMVKHDLPTAAFEVFDNKEAACSYIDNLGAPVVVKADGLAQGKGVVVAQSIEEAKCAVEACFDGSFGEAGAQVVIEECLEGPECSLLAFVAGGEALCMPCVQDHKRAFDNDLGPNTGGMGVYAPVPEHLVSEQDRACMLDIMQRAAKATAKTHDTIDYRGVLYGGFMLTKQGPKLLEFNARFGDPETQVLMTLLESDVVELMHATARGFIRDSEARWAQGACVCVVLASEGYPGQYEKGKVILGVEDAKELEGVEVFHAGTVRNIDGELITAGGRVLNVVAHAKDFESARALAYEACGRIEFEGKQYRHDIGLKAQL